MNNNNILQGKNMLIFKGYRSNKVAEVVEAYRKKTGYEPTIMIVRPGYKVIGTFENLIESKQGSSGLMLASHLLSQSEIDDLKTGRESEIAKTNDRDGLDKADLIRCDFSVKSRTQGRPKTDDALCPHCQQRIMNYNNLGFWYGWAQGIEPPYWEELRLYVFRRDKFICQSCKKTFAIGGLECHHIEHKEEGGSDSARNLLTLCRGCHLDNKPIMQGEENTPPPPVI